ncbi:nitrogenase iron-molybdenum cofactor biosynthesis protein NifN [Amphibacillus cookii]|uniref:nitrogenase iron-molybdenum cofactor biosynthesis protein NifN n=1 Tax=Amphibacillus cookii TaxID=767787 RepID=UPI001958E926|nr:nitrogenase iron-molybdenum cofactor biosynthesis protein NifN [Amphibacillus cookii]MBM7541900.1 nitrogenase molybdenum-iron protein NifN [Amphibacillus cookii]
MTICFSEKKLVINSLKISQTVGGVLALQGIFRSIPILHSAQGCAAFIKALMTNHYRDPVALQTTALTELDIIFGAEQNMIKAIDTVIDKNDPSVIAVLSTALSETVDDDMEKNLKNYRENDPTDLRLIFPVSLPDFEGSLESGYARTVEAFIVELSHCILENRPVKKQGNRVNLIPGSHLTSGDVMEIKTILSDFGLEVMTFPDLSHSLSATLADGYSPLTQGGSTLTDLKKIASAQLTIVVGNSMEKAGQIIEELHDIPYILFDSLTGLEKVDHFFSWLKNFTQSPVPSRYQWERKQLIDAMVDSHFYFGGKSYAMASEPDHLYTLVMFLKELGCMPAKLVSSYATPALKTMEETVEIGDLDDLERGSDAAEFWLSNSHGQQGAGRLSIPFMPIGFPITGQIANGYRRQVGFRGTIELLLAISQVII